MAFSLTDLEARIATRAGDSPESSYTAKLLAAGVRRCAQKFGEEAVEAVVAATANDKTELTGEAADVLYHLLVLLKASGVSLSDVMAELESRQAQSGLEEKASR